MVVDQVHWTLVLYILTLFLPWLPNLPKVSRELDHGWFPNFLVIDQINKEAQYLILRIILTKIINTFQYEEAKTIDKGGYNVIDN